ncbi:DUF2079 domain-containing protein [Bailinhaonella thermotolerans]|uniref:DUF2079 domain-containing protein n=1 Tax=Bailinhaonella thermotolerans TaxID=1070861 RepID=A0A3A4BFK3_9ACTN|nr:DUF2079 domain-containing protein [Bailinhaonella thermotolerans]RJL33262.1 DUF2079 domain-containing protein [Bailinhaonella thermotolerans]
MAVAGTAKRGGGEAAPPRTGSDARVVGLITLAAAALYAGVGLLQFTAFRAGTYDLVIFDQAIRSYSRFESPVSIAKGVHNEFGRDFPVLGDHWSPILMLLAPLYWLHDGPKTLIVAQAVLIAASIPVVWAFARRRLGNRAAIFAAGAYALSWPVAEAVVFDFHEVAFAPLLVALMIERFDAGKARWGLAAAGLLLLVKEDMGLLIAGYGLYLLAARRQWWRMGLVFLVGGLGAVWIATRLLIPLFGGKADYYWAYGKLGPDIPGVLGTMVTDPLRAIETLGTPQAKLWTLACLGAMVLFACLLSPLTLVALPPLAARLLAGDFPNWWGTQYHYNAFIVAVLFLAAIDGTSRLRAYGETWAKAVLVVSVLLMPFFAYGRLVTDTIVGDDRRGAARAAVAQVPSGVLVESANRLGPALSARARVLLWDRTPRFAPWVVADVSRRTFPFKSVEEQRNRVDFLRRHGYRTVFERGGYIVLRTTRPAR